MTKRVKMKRNGEYVRDAEGNVLEEGLWDEHTLTAEDRTEEQCLASILGAQVKVPINDSLTRDRTIYELLAKATGRNDNEDLGLSKAEADDILSRHGITHGTGTDRWDNTSTDEYIRISNQNKALSDLLNDHAWGGEGRCEWRPLIERLDGAVKSGKSKTGQGSETMRTKGGVSSWVALPSRLIFGGE